MDHDLLDESLLLRYIKGDVSTEEIDQVNDWIQKSENNRKILEDISLIDYAGEVLSIMKNTNPETSLTMVNKKIRKHKIQHIYTWGQRVAAVLFIPLLCVSLFLLLQRGTPSEEQYAEAYSAPGTVTSLTLSDGTKVWLNANSSIKYPVKFTKNTRNVEMTGEAYFSVEKDASRPFFVNVNDVYKVKVLGTEFNIEAYPSDSVVKTTLIEGLIQMVAIDDPDRVYTKLHPGEQTSWNIKSGTFNNLKVNTITYSSWKDGKIIFKDNSMKEVITALEKRYNVRFVVQNQQLMKHRFTGTFTDQQLVQILEHFKISSNIHYEIKGQRASDGSPEETIVFLK